MCHFLQLPLPTGTQTHSCYSLDLSSEYRNGLSRPVYCITLVSAYTPLLICVLCFVLHILTLSSQLFVQHFRFLFTQREPSVIFAKQMFILLYAYFLMWSCIKILLLKQNIIFNCTIMFLMYCFQALQTILGAQW